MKFSLNVILAASAIFTGAIATGTQAGQAASNKAAASSGQTTTSSASDVLSSCVSQIKVYTAKINSTYAALPKSPSSAQQSTAITSIKADLNDVVDIITSTTTKVGKCSKTNVALQPLINHSEEILFEVFGTLQGAVTKIGSNTLTLLGNPVTSVENGLSSLLVGVEDVHSGVVKVAWGACNNIISSHFSGVATPILAIGSTLSSECSCTH